MTNIEQIQREQERVNKLLKGVTEGEWVIVCLEPARIKTVAGIIEVNGSHSYADFHLMAESSRLARAYLTLLDAHLALHAQLAQAGEREKALREAIGVYITHVHACLGIDDDKMVSTFTEALNGGPQ